MIGLKDFVTNDAIKLGLFVREPGHGGMYLAKQALPYAPVFRIDNFRQGSTRCARFEAWLIVNAGEIVIIDDNTAFSENGDANLIFILKKAIDKGFTGRILLKTYAAPHPALVDRGFAIEEN
jgi:hypothetical protein